VHSTMVRDDQTMEATSFRCGDSGKGRGKTSEEEEACVNGNKWGREPKR